MFAVYAAIGNWDSCTTDGVATLKCLEVVIENLLTMSSALVIVILFIMFVVGSFKYLTSGGDQEKLKGARDTFKYAFIGLLIYMSAFLLLNTIQLLFLGDPKDPKNANILKFTLPNTFPRVSVTAPTGSPSSNPLSCKEYCQTEKESRSGKSFAGGVCAFDILGNTDPTDCPNADQNSAGIRYYERGLPDHLQYLCQRFMMRNPFGKCCCTL